MFKKIRFRLSLFFQRVFRKVNAFFISTSIGKFIFLFVISAVVIALAFTLLPDFTKDIISVTLGFFIGTIGVYFLGVIRRATEDYNKVINDKSHLDKRKYDPSIMMHYTFNDVKICDYFHAIAYCDSYQFVVKDDPDKEFMVTDLIANNYFTILNFHADAYKRNVPTVRLDKTEIANGVMYLYLSRSNFFNHLVTNRGLDILFDGTTTLRDVYEPGPFLSSFEDSKFSNHVGINSFLTLEYEGKTYLVLARRSRKSTIAKRQVTAAIASRLVYYPELPFSTTVAKIPFAENTIKLFTGKFDDILTRAQAELTFLGFGQNPYEGGKPQFYYNYHVKCDANSFNEIWTKIANSKIKAGQIIDSDVYLLMIDISTLKYLEHDIFQAKRYKQGKFTSIHFVVEKSFLANLFLYKTYLERQGRLS